MNYRPTLEPRTIPLQKLLLDPNNPRFLQDINKLVPEQEYADSGVQNRAHDAMVDYQIDNLVRSIDSNGWQPVDSIFVKKIKIGNEDHYVVLEGNRRLTALRVLKKRQNLAPELAADIDPVTVLEVVGNGDEQELRAQITYLLGVRHHGSLKRWSAFAQAVDIFKRYLALAQQTAETFKWDEKPAKLLAQTLGIDVGRVEERLRVYRAIKQLQTDPNIGDGPHSRHYTLLKEAVHPRSAGNPLRSYIKQDSSTFLLTKEAVERIEILCKFSEPNRSGAPINNPDEWRALSDVLKIPDPQEQQAALTKITVDGNQPSAVLAERQAGLAKPRWDLWLDEVASLLSGVTFGNLNNNPDAARIATAALATILDQLSAVGQESTPKNAG